MEDRERFGRHSFCLIDSVDVWIKETTLYKPFRCSSAVREDITGTAAYESLTEFQELRLVHSELGREVNVLPQRKKKGKEKHFPFQKFQI